MCAASYYTAFFSVAIVVYFLRKKGYKSLPEAINVRYGSLATVQLIFLYEACCLCLHCQLFMLQVEHRSATCRPAFCELALSVRQHSCDELYTVQPALMTRGVCRLQVGFGLAVLFRLYQEVWSNALVVGGFYGAFCRKAVSSIADRAATLHRPSGQMYCRALPT